MEAEIVRIIQQEPAYAYLALYGVLLLCGVGMPMPEDIFLIAGGYSVHLAHQHGLAHPSLGLMIAVGMFGVLTGDVMLFLVGRWAGPRVTRVWPFRVMLSEKRRDRVSHFFTKHGVWTAFFARFAAGLRAPTYLLAGSAGMRFRTFILADGSAAAISVPLLVWAAYRFGPEVKRWLTRSKVAFGILVGVVVLCLVVRALFKWRAARREKLARAAGAAVSTPSTALSPTPSRSADPPAATRPSSPEE